MVEGPRPVSRRDLFLGRFNDRAEETRPSPGDVLFERVGEGLSFLAVLYLAYKGSSDRVVTYQVKSESEIKDAPGFGKSLEQLGRLMTVANVPARQLGELSSSWRQTFLKHKSRPVIRTTIDDKGNPKTTIEIEYYDEWEEPWQLTAKGLNHYQISGWENYLGSLASKASKTRADLPQAFNLDKDRWESLYYSEQAADSGSQLIPAMAGYAAVGTLFCFYEEAVSKLNEGENQLFSDHLYVKRRTLMKILATVAGALGIRDLQRSFVEENKDLLREIKGEVRLILDRMEIPPEDNFRRFFGSSPAQLRNILVEVRDKITAGLESGYGGGFIDFNWPAVRNNLVITKDRTEGALEEFDGLFSFDEFRNSYVIPQELTDMTKYLWATREIINFAQSKSSHVNIRHLQDALLLGGGFAAVAILSELVFPLSEKLRR